MRVIQNENVAFRCPNTLKEQLSQYADRNDLHVSAVIRSACSQMLKRERLSKSIAIERLIEDHDVELDAFRSKGWL